MFLYAKVVLSNLLDQPTLSHFERELEEENFPLGMDQAYVIILPRALRHNGAEQG